MDDETRPCRRLVSKVGAHVYPRPAARAPEPFNTDQSLGRLRYGDPIDHSLGRVRWNCTP